MEMPELKAILTEDKVCIALCIVSALYKWTDFYFFVVYLIGSKSKYQWLYFDLII